MIVLLPSVVYNTRSADSGVTIVSASDNLNPIIICVGSTADINEYPAISNVGRTGAAGIIIHTGSGAFFGSLQSGADGAT